MQRRTPNSDPIVTDTRGFFERFVEYHRLKIMGAVAAAVIFTGLYAWKTAEETKLLKSSYGHFDSKELTREQALSLIDAAGLGRSYNKYFPDFMSASIRYDGTSRQLSNNDALTQTYRYKITFHDKDSIDYELSFAVFPWNKPRVERKSAKLDRLEQKATADPNSKEATRETQGVGNLDHIAGKLYNTLIDEGYILQVGNRIETR